MYKDRKLETSASLGQTISYSEGDISLSEVISALTFALDFTDGAVPGHSLRTCLLGMRIAEALHVSAADLGHLYYALLLKDIGCSDSATRLSQIMAADDRPMLPSTGWVGDIAADPALLERIWREVLPGIPLPARIGRYRIAITEDHDPMLAWELESSRVTQTLENLGMSDVTVNTIHLIDERWDGSGLPSGLCHQQIPLLARICSIAQTLDAFATEHGSETALRMVRSRRGTWFDPEIVRAAQHLHTSGKLWQVCQATDVEATRTEVMRLDPGLSSALTPERVDRICEAFGNTVDAKSPFTYRHSIGVTDVAVSLATELGLAPDRVSLVRRAAFLHDIGKLAVPNGILDKRARLSPQEWLHVTRHPALSGSILRRVRAFRELAALAAEHHERLDGSGYPFQLCDQQLSIESRIIAMADCYAAMAEDRPYRAGLKSQEILKIIAEDVPHRLDPTCFTALCSTASRWICSMPTSGPSPSTVQTSTEPAHTRHDGFLSNAC